jgi:hypothetical protein
MFGVDLNFLGPVSQELLALSKHRSEVYRLKRRSETTQTSLRIWWALQMSPKFQAYSSYVDNNARSLISLVCCRKNFAESLETLSQHCLLEDGDGDLGRSWPWASANRKAGTRWKCGKVPSLTGPLVQVNNVTEGHLKQEECSVRRMTSGDL